MKLGRRGNRSINVVGGGVVAALGNFETTGDSPLFPIKNNGWIFFALSFILFL